MEPTKVDHQEVPRAELVERLNSVKVHRTLGKPTLKKPVLLMVVVSRLERGVLRHNQIRFRDLEDDYRRTLEVATGKRVRNLVDPFIRLKTADFWTLETPANVPWSSSKRFLYRDDVWAEFDRVTYDALSSSSSTRLLVLSAMLKTWIPQDRREEVTKLLVDSLEDRKA